MSYGRKRTRRNGGRKRNSHAQEVKKIARLIGCVERGRKNPDSQISAAYEQGKNAKPRKRRSLY